jgi:hypothetical protein
MKNQEKQSSTRRNPGRMDGVQWNGDQFICTYDVDGHYLDSDVESAADDDELYEGDTNGLHGSDRARQPGPVVSLLDIARPAKQKGEAESKVCRVDATKRSVTRNCEGVRDG